MYKVEIDDVTLKILKSFSKLNDAIVFREYTTCINVGYGLYAWTDSFKLPMEIGIDSISRLCEAMKWSGSNILELHENYMIIKNHNNKKDKRENKIFYQDNISLISEMNKHPKELITKGGLGDMKHTFKLSSEDIKLIMSSPKILKSSDVIVRFSFSHHELTIDATTKDSADFSDKCSIIRECDYEGEDLELTLHIKDFNILSGDYTIQAYECAFVFNLDPINDVDVDLHYIIATGLGN